MAHIFYRAFSISALAFVIWSMGASTAAAEPAEHAGGPPSRILVKFNSGIDGHGVLAGLGAGCGEEIGSLGVHALKLPSTADETALLKVLKQHGDVEFVEIDQLREPSAVTANDPRFFAQASLWNMRAPDAWEITTGSSSVVVAVIDTGVNGSNLDLIGKVLPGWNTVSNNSDSSPINHHGNYMAGAVAAVTNNQFGVAAVCWQCQVLPVRVSNLTSGLANDTDIAEALQWAADRGARVAIVGYPVSESATVTAAAQYFESRGGVVVVPSGNDGSFRSAADNPSMLTVGAVDVLDDVFSWSNTGNAVDLVADGLIYSVTSAESVTSYLGTSAAAAMVAGAAALVLSNQPGMSPQDVKATLIDSAEDINSAGWDAATGWGRVDAYAALTSEIPDVDTTLPNVSMTYPANGATVSGSLTMQASASDNVGVESVAFAVDGVTKCTDTAAAYSCSWNSATAANGSHTLRATARDEAGNSKSHSISVNVQNTTSDTTLPSVSLTSPASGATVSGSTAIAASASDNVGVAKVEFYFDGALRARETTSPYSYSWNTTTSSNGSHTVMARAYDAANNSRSASRTVTVSNSTSDTTLPSVSITSPASGATVSGTLTIQASASDNVGVQSVTFAVDGSTKCTDTTASYACSWDSNTVSNGSHTLTATARDAAGNTRSHSLSINVQNSTGNGNGGSGNGRGKGNK